MLHNLKGEAVKKQLRGSHHGQLVHRIRQANQLKMPLRKTENKGLRGAFQSGGEQPPMPENCSPPWKAVAEKEAVPASSFMWNWTPSHHAKRIADSLFSRQAIPIPARSITDLPPAGRRLFVPLLLF